jgi:AhpD family alkylhydroperoxidase
MKQIDPSTATGITRTLLDGIAKKRGYLPPLMRVLAHSPPVLSGYIGFASALGRGALTTAMHERIALAVSQANDCRGCLAAHIGYARAAGLTDEEIVAARSFSSADPRAAEVLSFARIMLETRGHLSEADRNAVRESDLGEEALVEIAALVAINILTNSVSALAEIEAAPGACSRVSTFSSSFAERRTTPRG